MGGGETPPPNRSGAGTVVSPDADGAARGVALGPPLRRPLVTIEGGDAATHEDLALAPGLGAGSRRGRWWRSAAARARTVVLLGGDSASRGGALGRPLRRPRVGLCGRVLAA